MKNDLPKWAHEIHDRWLHDPKPVAQGTAINDVAVLLLAVIRAERQLDTLCAKLGITRRDAERLAKP